MKKSGRRKRSRNAEERAAIQAKLTRRRERQRVYAMSSPVHFRAVINLSVSPRRSLHQVVQAWQTADFAALDAAWAHLAGDDRRAGFPARPIPPGVGEPEGIHREGADTDPCDPPPTREPRAGTGKGAPPTIRRAYIERPRGHSKTSDMAIQIAWILLAARTPVTGVAAAADKEQAALLLNAIRHLRHVNPTLCGDLSFVEGAVRNSRTGSRLDLISSDVGSSYGILPDFVICDELCHWPGPELWYSLLSSAAKKPNCVLAVLTNAGVGRGWTWQVRENASRSKDWYFSSLTGPHAPWITEPSLDEQKAMLPPAVYERLWLNRWQHSDGEFVSLAEAEACIDPALQRFEQGQPGFEYIAAIDYAEKRDFTVGVICHRDGDRVVIDRMDVVRPTPMHTTQTAWVEDWIDLAAERFPLISFVIDEFQLLSTYQRYSSRYSMKRFQFLGGEGNHSLALHLRQMITQRKLAWYPGCGSYPPVADALWSDEPLNSATVDRDDLATELSSLLLKQSSSGRVRIDHKWDGIHHDDRAFALGAACLELVEKPVVSPALLKITSPACDGGFAFWEC